jgi:glycosyltransferase involved in cell wall biosynthesis
VKIAIFHDYFDEIGGAEITLLYMARGLNAAIFTTNINRNKIRELGFSDIRIESVGPVFNIKYLKQILTQLRFLFIKISGYDLYIFGGSYSIYASRNHSPNLWYCFSPLRGLYDLRYFKKSLFNIKLLKEIQIYFDKKAVKNIHKIIASSLNIEERIEKYYKRSSNIVNLPIDTGEFKYAPDKDYWLSAGRIDPYKRIELIIETFSKIQSEKLTIVGGSSEEFKNYFESLKRNSTKNITFTGPIFNRGKLVDLYANCKGFIVTAKDEDFGMTVVEAMASGKPVIAPNEGGYKETVINGVTGKLIDDINVDKLINALQELGNDPQKYKNACIEQAGKFDIQIFIKKIKSAIGNFCAS